MCFISNQGAAAHAMKTPGRFAHATTCQRIRESAEGVPLLLQCTSHVTNMSQACHTGAINVIVIGRERLRT